MRKRNPLNDDELELWRLLVERDSSRYVKSLTEVLQVEAGRMLSVRGSGVST